MSVRFGHTVTAEETNGPKQFLSKAGLPPRVYLCLCCRFSADESICKIRGVLLASQRFSRHQLSARLFSASRVSPSSTFSSPKLLSPFSALDAAPPTRQHVCPSLNELCLPFLCVYSTETNRNQKLHPKRTPAKVIQHVS